MDLPQRIETLLTPALEPYGYAIVRIQISGATRPILQIMIERLDGSAITVDDCTHVSRIASVHLDVADPMPSAFVLEVSSPGLDRPLVKPKDYLRFCGHEILVVLHAPIEGRRRFIGLLEEATETTITISFVESKDGSAQRHVQKINIGDIKSAKLQIDFAKV